MIAFSCPKCKFQLTRHDSEAGSKIACPSCSKQVTVPEQPAEILDHLWQINSDKEPLPSSSPTPKDKPDMIRFACPHCGAGIKAAKNKAGTRAKCPKCQLPFEIPIPKGELREPSQIQTEVVPALSPPLASTAYSDDFASQPVEVTPVNPAPLASTHSSDEFSTQPAPREAPISFNEGAENLENRNDRKGRWIGIGSRVAVIAVPVCAVVLWGVRSETKRGF